MNNTDFEKELREQYRQLGAVLDKETILTTKTLKQYKRIRMKLDLTDWFIFGGVCLAVVWAVCLGYFEAEIAIWEIVLILALIVLTVYVFTLTPRELELTQELIRLKLVFGKVEIRYDEIAKVAPFNYSGSNLRLCGASAIHTHIGWFWNSNIGTYTSYVNNRSECIYVKLKSGKKIVFSVAHSTEIIEAIRSNMES